MLYQHELSISRALAVDAGKILTRYFGTGFEVQMKGWADPVTVADRESEALIRATLRHEFPDDAIEGEEEGAQPGTSGRLWLVDPVDGTANYAGGLPFFAVVITLMDPANPNEAVLNVTYDPIRNELFHAVRGQGAFLNDAPIKVSSQDDLAQALIDLHYSNNARVWRASIELVTKLTEKAPYARNLGSTALGQAYVAMGRLHAHAKITSGRYDVVGGNLLITEAGGVVTDLNGAPWRMETSLLAANPALHAQLVAITAGTDRR
ncbi:MAG TPA: inositol monophosphatase [Chloroflexota bacterium]|nr:inositol monophosphatase [Chloroflexota bacterium]